MFHGVKYGVGGWELGSWEAFDREKQEVENVKSVFSFCFYFLFLFFIFIF